MNKNNKKPQSEPKCRVISYKNGIHKVEVIPEEKALKIKPTSYHIFIDRVRMKAYVRLSHGKVKKFEGRIMIVGGKPLGLLKKLMMRPGVFLTPYEIGNIGEYLDSYFIKDNIIAYAYKLRKYFFIGNGEKYIKSDSRPYKIALNGDISFCWIERYYEDAEQEAT